MTESDRDKTLQVMARAMGAPVEGPEGEKWGEYPPFNRFARLALDALEASGRAVVPGWQPIESAPKDGAFVDLLFRGDIRMTDMFWRDDQWWIGDPTDPEYCTGVVCPKATPTHWMPLPLSPASPCGKAVVQEASAERSVANSKPVVKEDSE